MLIYVLSQALVIRRPYHNFTEPLLAIAIHSIFLNRISLHRADDKISYHDSNLIAEE